MFLDCVDSQYRQGTISEQLSQILKSFYRSYTQAIEKAHADPAAAQKVLNTFLELVIQQVKAPFAFEIYHQGIRSPFDYYSFGMDFFRPIVNVKSSKIIGQQNLKQMDQQLNRQENVILFANHQTEPDPQIISLLLENTYPQIGETMIFVAGHRVITDPMAVPLSMGCNLLCIFSKKYIDHPPHEKEQKLQHNQRTMKKMSLLLSEGGKCIYVAPSGGRDRPDEFGEVKIDSFDTQSIEMFYLMAQHSGHPTHFYPLALSTYHLTPPPKKVEKELGEQRIINPGPAFLAFGQEIDMENFPGSKEGDKKIRRQNRADHIWNLVKKDYALFQR